MQRVDDPDDQRIVDYLHLNDAAARAAAGLDRRSGCAIVEGVVALDTILRAGLRLRSVLVSPKRATSLAAMLSQVPADVPIYVAERPVLQRIVGFDLHRGVLASAERPSPVLAEDLAVRSHRVVVTEGLNDHENLGSLFRNAAALGFDGALLDQRTADPLYRRSIRVSSGWALVLAHAWVPTIGDAAEVLRRRGFRVVALTPARDAVAVDAAAAEGMLDGRVALVVGAEGPGLSTAAVDAADVALRIPMRSGVDSLNVATSLAVVGAFAASRDGWSTAPARTEDV